MKQTHKQTTKSLPGETEVFLDDDKSGSNLLKVSRATFWRRVKDKTLPSPIKIGGATRWYRHELLARVAEFAAARNEKAR